MTAIEKEEQFQRLQWMRASDGDNYLFEITDAAYWSARPIEEIELEIKRRQDEDKGNN